MKLFFKRIAKHIYHKFYDFERTDGRTGSVSPDAYFSHYVETITETIIDHMMTKFVNGLIYSWIHTVFISWSLIIKRMIRISNNMIAGVEIPPGGLIYR